MNTPKVGDGVTMNIGTDSYPGTVISVTASGKTVKVKADNAEHAEGYDYYRNQVYTFSPNLNGEVRRFYKGGQGYYRDNKSGFHLSEGRSKHSDPNF